MQSSQSLHPRQVHLRSFQNAEWRKMENHSITENALQWDQKLRCYTDSEKQPATVKGIPDISREHIYNPNVYMNPVSGIKENPKPWAKSMNRNTWETVRPAYTYRNWINRIANVHYTNAEKEESLSSTVKKGTTRALRLTVVNMMKYQYCKHYQLNPVFSCIRKRPGRNNRKLWTLAHWKVQAKCQRETGYWNKWGSVYSAENSKHITKKTNI